MKTTISMKVMKKITVGLAAAVLLLTTGVLTSCTEKSENPSDGSAAALTKVRFLLDWVPNTNHTGVYVAKAKGYFAAEGLDVEIIQPAEDTGVEMVAAGQAEFAVTFQETVTMARTAPTPLGVKAIAAIIQHNTSGFACKNDQGIQSVKDLEGKRYGGWGTDLEEKIIGKIMRDFGADPSTVEIQRDGSYDFVAGLGHTFDFSWIYYGWEGIAAEVKGVDINFLPWQQLAPELDFYTPVIITGDQLIEEQPELIQKFMRAVTKGYQDCINDPQGNVEHLLQGAPETDRDIAMASAIYLADKYQSDAVRWGEMKQEVWQSFADFLHDNGIIERDLVAADAFTNQFLP